jgi:hypothetical protein
MHCYVYRSNRKLDTYIYLTRKDDFKEVPEPLMQVFGQAEFALEFELTPDRTLAQEDPAVVLQNLREQGFHLQMPAENQEPL